MRIPARTVWSFVLSFAIITSFVVVWGGIESLEDAQQFGNKVIATVKDGSFGGFGPFGGFVLLAILVFVLQVGWRGWQRYRGGQHVVQEGVISKARVSMPGTVTCDKHPGGVTLTHRGPRWVGVLLVGFSVLWNAILLWMLSQSVKQPGFTPSDLLSRLPFIVVGLAVAYVGLAQLLNETIINLTTGELSIQHRPLPWPGNRTLPASGLKQLFCKKVVRSNSEGGSNTSYSLMAILNDGQVVALLEGIESANTARYLEQEMEDWLGIQDMAVTGELPG